MWQKFLAKFRLSQKAICEQSKGKGEYNDYHDYPDTLDGYPAHFHLCKCRHCGKDFRI